MSHWPVIDPMLTLPTRVSGKLWKAMLKDDKEEGAIMVTSAPSATAVEILLFDGEVWFLE